MITRTSLSHPTALRAVRIACFQAAADCAATTRKQGQHERNPYPFHAELSGDVHGVSYASNRKGSSFMRADVILPTGSDLCKLRFYAAGSGNYNYVWEVADAMGAAGFTYLHRLCDALARPATEKVW